MGCDTGPEPHSTACTGAGFLARAECWPALPHQAGCHHSPCVMRNCKEKLASGHGRLVQSLCCSGTDSDTAAPEAAPATRPENPKMGAGGVGGGVRSHKGVPLAQAHAPP